MTLAFLASADAAFLAPHVLAWLVAVPLVAAALLLRESALERMIARAIGPRAGELRGTTGGAAPRFLRLGLFVAGSACALLAIARPTWGSERSLVTPHAVDCVIALDVSRSMLARDVAPSRLERAKALLRGLSTRLAADRIGLVVFAGDARLVVPLTRDMESFVELLDDATPDAVRRGGTDLGAALAAALAAIEGATGQDAGAPAIVLISDGEDLSGEGMKAAESCAARGVTVHAIGIGTPLGGKIPVPAATARAGETYLADRAGNDVVSSLDASGLRAIAAATGGAYVDGNADANALLDLVDERVIRAAKSTAVLQPTGTPRLVAQWPLLVAWLLWLLELAWADRKAR